MVEGGVEDDLADGPYVLSLYPASDGSLFTGGYQPFEQGIGVVGDNGTVTLGYGEKTSIDELRSIAAKVPPRQ